MLLYGQFEEKGYRVEAHTPDSDGEPIAFEVRLFIGDTLVRTLLLSMLHVPVFGVFEFTVALFTDAIADGFDGTEAQTCMETKRAELGGLTPTQALRVGMAKEILDLLRSDGAPDDRETRD